MSDNLEKELKKLRDERQKKFTEEDWEGALEIHDRILELSPSALRYANRGSILYRLGRLESAIESYRTALEMEPSLKRARADLERLEAQLEKQQAEQMSNDMGIDIVEAPEKVDPYWQLQQKIAEYRDRRQMAIEKEDWEEALQYHLKIVQLEPTAQRYATLGSIFYRLGRYEEAIESYENAVAMDPSLEKVKNDLQKLRRQQEEQQKEEENLLNAADQADDIPVSTDKSSVDSQVEELRKQRQDLIEDERWEDALAVHDQILNIDPNGLRYSNRGAMLYRLGRYNESIEAYKIALEMDPTLEGIAEKIQHLEAMIEEESLIDWESDIEPGQAAADLTAEEITEKINEYRAQRQVCLDNKEWDKALEYHDLIIELEPTALRYVNRGSMLYRLKKLEEAIESYKIALEMSPNMGRAQMDLERMETELRAKQQTQEQAEKKQADESQVIADVAEKLEELRQERQKFVQEDKWEDALAVHEEILQIEPTAARYVTKGSMLYALGRVDEAIFTYRQALELDPNFERAQSDLQKLRDSEMERLRVARQDAMNAEDWNKALYFHDVILTLEPSALRYANRGSILYRMNRLVDAINAYKKALSLDPTLEKAKQDLEKLQDELRNLPMTAIEFEDQEVNEIDEQIFTILDSEDEEVFHIETTDPIPEAIPEPQAPTQTYTRPERLPLYTLEGHTKEIIKMQSIHNEKQLITSSKDNTLRLWDLETKKCQHTFEGHEDWIRCFTINKAETEIITASDDWNIKIWNIKKKIQEHSFLGHNMPITNVCLNPSETIFYSTSRDHTIRIWDTKTQTVINTIEAHSDWVTHFLLTPDGSKAISGSFDKTIRIWETKDNTCLQELQGHNSPIQKIQLTNDGKSFISIAYEPEMYIWDVETGTTQHVFYDHISPVLDIALSTDNQYLASTDKQGNINIFQFPDYSLVTHLYYNQKSISHLHFTPDSQYLVGASSDSIIYLWNLTGKLIHYWEIEDRISTISIIGNKKWILLGTSKGEIQILDYSII
ncbi:MAG TPA: tetratricopeptide repeat protein [Planctomycetota bacterium]|nr:tetratricopeptide repeat protein [Planctomycetota bacterium]HQB00554.1 tetratricopeptide repeat protein [Planctomycetota bacterium]